MPIKPWRATAIQMPSRLATQAPSPEAARQIITGNIAKAVELIDLACKSAMPPKLVVLPEFALQGPPHGLSVADWLDRAVCAVPGWISADLQEAARRNRIYVAFNQFESDPLWPGRYFNASFLIDPDGECILRFRRINTASWPSPHDFLDAYVAQLGWDGLFPVVETELGRIGLIACGELAVPEVARCLMLRGAEIILHPTNEQKSAAQEAAKVARAAENMVYLISANVAGGIGFSADGSVLGGRSHIIDYKGNSLAFTPSTIETVATSAMIDVESLRAARRGTGMDNVLLRARWEAYQPFYARAKAYPPNVFLEAPMKDVADTRAAVETAMSNISDGGLLAAEAPATGQPALRSFNE